MVRCLTALSLAFTIYFFFNFSSILVCGCAFVSPNCLYFVCTVTARVRLYRITVSFRWRIVPCTNASIYCKRTPPPKKKKRRKRNIIQEAQPICTARARWPDSATRNKTPHRQVFANQNICLIRTNRRMYQQPRRVSPSGT